VVEGARRALVTGGSRGIGAAIARALAADGYRVAVHCRAERGLAEAVAAGLPGDGHVVVQADVTDPEAVRRAVDETVDALGGIDLLVNNAGLYGHHPVASTSYEEWQAAWRELVDVNLLGPAWLTWCVVDHLLHRPEGPGGGRIVTVGSRGAYRGEPDAPAYGAAKAGVHALTQSLAVALAPSGIAAAAVAPGFTETDMAAEYLTGARGEAIRGQSPFGRVARPEEVAAAVVWLASAEAEWASGTVIDLNGASYLR
jgi:NAD(P)-dependent dehydrogenase (short-subunit alcohol dehydrogenase family)